MASLNSTKNNILKQKIFTEEELRTRDEQTEEAIRNDLSPTNGNLPPMPQWNDGTQVWDDIPRLQTPKEKEEPTKLTGATQKIEQERKTETDEISNLITTETSLISKNSDPQSN